MLPNGIFSAGRIPSHYFKMRPDSVFPIIIASADAIHRLVSRALASVDVIHILCRVLLHSRRSNFEIPRVSLRGRSSSPGTILFRKFSPNLAVLSDAADFRILSGPAFFNWATEATAERDVESKITSDQYSTNDEGYMGSGYALVSTYCLTL